MVDLPTVSVEGKEHLEKALDHLREYRKLCMVEGYDKSAALAFGVETGLLTSIYTLEQGLTPS